jgi:glycosyltransferase involved in cell wall biosynthesis
MNCYLTDAELDAELSRADVVALPYRRSSASGPMHIVMACGLPMIVTDLPALREAADGYAGAIFVPPADSEALGKALIEVAQLVGRRFRDPRDWSQTRTRFAGLFRSLGRERSPDILVRPSGLEHSRSSPVRAESTSV